MALQSAVELWKMSVQRDARVVNFDIVQYLDYLRMTFLKFNRFTFENVLKYDREYRALQLQDQFSWGTYVPELYEVHLSGRNKAPFTPKRKPTTDYNPPKRKKPHYCDVFNRGDLCDHNPCRYLHLCTTCNQAHPASRCPGLKKA